MSCCPPSKRDDDRTHSVRYWQEYFDGDPGAPPVMEDSGTFDIACTHNDAVTLAETRASSCDGRMWPSKTRAIWKGGDYEQGEGTKWEIRVTRGPAEEEYDTNRQREGATP